MNGSWSMSGRAWFALFALAMASCAGGDGEPVEGGDNQQQTLLLGRARARGHFEQVENPLIERWLRRACTDRNGDYKCACASFFNPDQIDCGGGPDEGVDECALGTDDCSENASRIHIGESVSGLFDVTL